MPVARLISRSHLTIALAYLTGYVALDWISYVYPFASFGITPWNPQTGLSFALILLFGPEFLPWLFVAPFLGDLLVRQLPLPIITQILMVVVSGVGYGGATTLLLSPRIGFDPTLSSKQSLMWLTGVALVSALLVAGGHFAVLLGADLVTSADVAQLTLRAFIGDMIGVMVVTPFVLIVLTRRRIPDISWDIVLMVALIAAALWLIFGFAESYRFQLFYLLFIPIMWIAVRFGLEGVTTGLVVTQIGLILAIHASRQTVGDVLSYQALMAALAATGLAIGVLVSEQHRTQQQLRLQQEALNRASRLGAMGEFAAAVAHEINQPLTAIANFARLAKGAAEETPANMPEVVAAASRTVEQVDRAADVVRRLRDFIRLGRIEVEPTAIARLVAETHSFCRPELERYGIEFEARLQRELPPVIADALQIEQALVNLVRNSAEALAQAGRHDGRVIVEAERDAADRVVIRVRDNGPGLDPDLAGQPITPFATTKSEGLGLGLSLTRSIVEAHGGKLQIDSGPRGVVVSFSLPAQHLGGQAA
jgi:signal transduction histidine kinase